MIPVNEGRIYRIAHLKEMILYHQIWGPEETNRKDTLNKSRKYVLSHVLLVLLCI